MFGNCIHCDTYTRLNRLQICPSCFTVDEQLLQMARETLQNEGRMSVFELADRISIPYERILFWIQQRRLKPHWFVYRCPLCGRNLKYSFCECYKKTYASGGRGTPHHPEKFYSALRIQQRKENYWQRDSKIRKKQRKDIWLHT